MNNDNTKKEKYCTEANVVSEKLKGQFVVPFKSILVLLRNYIVFSFFIIFHGGL